MATYALVPGGGGDPWDWHLLVPELEGRGHDVVAVALPAGDDSAGWPEYADAIVEAIGDRTHVVLVAHSLGGFSAPLVCERRPVDLLVLVNAMIPRPGETGEEWWPKSGRQQAQQEYLASIGPPAHAADDDAIYYHDVPPEIVAEAQRRPEAEQSWTPMTEPWPLARWPDVPTRVLAGRDDRFLPATAQLRLARERLGIEADEMEGGHMVALSRPTDLAERLELFRQEMSEGRLPA